MEVSAIRWFQRKGDVETVLTIITIIIIIIYNNNNNYIMTDSRNRRHSARNFPPRHDHRDHRDPREQALFSNLNRSRGPAPHSRRPATVSTPSSTPIDPTLRDWRTTHRPTASKITRGWCPTVSRVHRVIVSHVSDPIAASKVSTLAKRIVTWDRKLCPMVSHLFSRRGTAIYLGHAGVTGAGGMFFSITIVIFLCVYIYVCIEFLSLLVTRIFGELSSVCFGNTGSNWVNESSRRKRDCSRGQYRAAIFEHYPFFKFSYFFRELIVEFSFL